MLTRESLYALMRSSVVTRADRLGPRLLAELASAGFPDWPMERVLSYAFAQRHARDRAEAIAQTWKLIPPQPETM